MRSFFDWFKQAPLDTGKPWLILGKGPSYSKRREYDVSEFHLLSLNHVVREERVDVAHIIDFGVVEACADSLDRNAGVLVMPWVPHIEPVPGKFQRGHENLAELMAKSALLRRLDEAGRLLWYNLRVPNYEPNARELSHLDATPVMARYFSAEAAVNLLAQAGVRRIRTLGVDGGSTYSTTFADLNGTTLLKGVHRDFDKQFREIARTVMSKGIDYSPLDVANDEPIRIFVGSGEAQMLAVKVLEYSLRKHTDLPVQIMPLHESNITFPLPRDPANRPRTPFSFHRFFIPALAGYKGRAIYMDSDMLVFQNVRHLWTQTFNGAELLAVKGDTYSDRRPQFSVMLLDCDRLRWEIGEIVAKLDRGELDYTKLMFEMKVAETRAEISPEWNSLEQYEDGKTALLHYTDMDLQPWLSRENKLGYLWMRNLFEAIDDGFITTDFVREEVKRGHVRPSLLFQVRRRQEDPISLKRAARLDRFFVPPAKAAAEAKTWRTRARNFMNGLIARAL